jgi:hypothetical protein
MRVPSSLARRMPARIRSTIKLRSNSAIAATITIMARPSAPSPSASSPKVGQEICMRVGGDPCFPYLVLILLD